MRMQNLGISEDEGFTFVDRPAIDALEITAYFDQQFSNEIRSLPDRALVADPVRIVIQWILREHEARLLPWAFGADNPAHESP